MNENTLYSFFKKHPEVSVKIEYNPLTKYVLFEFEDVLQGWCYSKGYYVADVKDDSEVSKIFDLAIKSRSAFKRRKKRRKSFVDSEEM